MRVTGQAFDTLLWKELWAPSPGFGLSRTPFYFFSSRSQEQMKMKYESTNSECDVERPQFIEDIVQNERKMKGAKYSPNLSNIAVSLQIALVHPAIFTWIPGTFEARFREQRSRLGCRNSRKLRLFPPDL